MGPSAAPDLTVFILAGGKSTRMGVDKAFIKLNGQTLLARSLDLARSVAADVRVAGSPEKFAEFAPAVGDIFPDRGPLGGIHAALRASRTDLNLMLAVDMPVLPVAFLEYLIDQARSAPKATAVVPRDNGRSQPLCAIYRRNFVATAETALLAGRNRIDSLYSEIEVRVIEKEEWMRKGFSSAIFRNLNTPEELELEKQRT
ncbi:MAG: molybdenum cofactor guanylyltransferase [Candidatus Sulfotelmatobacter sp.]